MLEDRRKLLIATVFILVVLVAGVVFGPMLISLSVVKTGPLYPNSYTNEDNLASTFYYANWQQLDSTPTLIIPPIYLDPTLSTLYFDYLREADFRVALSSTAAITGVQVKLRAANSNCNDIGAKLVLWIGQRRISDPRRIDLCPSQYGESLGGNGDTWGLTLAGSDVTSPAFSVWVSAEAQINPRITIATKTAYVSVDSLSLTLFTSEGPITTYTLSLSLNPASGKSTTTITGTVHSNPAQSNVNINLQVRRAGTSVWQNLVSGTTDLTGSVTKTWTPQQYGMTDDGTYIYQVVSEDNSISSAPASYIQSDNPITPPPVVTDPETMWALGLFGAAAIVSIVGLYLYRRRK